MAIYDCFTFFNELELLELRLRLLYDFVDYFVLVEGNKTHKNSCKPFYYDIHKEEFSKYKDKIIHIKVEDMPAYHGDGDWTIENYQRNAIMRGLVQCQPEDLILISDVDEIPNKEMIQKLKLNECEIEFFVDKKKRFLKKVATVLLFPEILCRHAFSINLLNRTALVFEQDLFYYFMNCKSKGKWQGSILSKYKNIKTPQKLRDRRMKLPRIQNGGWHFSYLGGTEKILLKLNSIVDTPQGIYTEDHVRTCIENGIDLYGRTGDEFNFQTVALKDLQIKKIEDFLTDYPYLYWSGK